MNAFSFGVNAFIVGDRRFDGIKANLEDAMRFRLRAFAFIGVVFAIAPLAVNADSTSTQIPAGTHVRFHLNETISSAKNRTGDTFTFILLDPISIDNAYIAADGTLGTGTIVLSGHAGSGGHEGDLTLRLDSLRTSGGHVVTFDDQRFEINGRNRKITSAVLGFVPFVGLGADFIRGNDVRVDPTTPIETVLKHPATITEAGVATPPPASRLGG
jgi:hypothetical protein